MCVHVYTHTHMQITSLYHVSLTKYRRLCFPGTFLLIRDTNFLMVKPLETAIYVNEALIIPLNTHNTPKTQATMEHRVTITHKSKNYVVEKLI